MRVNEQGRSMIEMLGVLAIVGVLSVGGIAGYSKAMNKFKTNKMIDQINMIATNIRTLYSSQKTYENLTNTIATKIGVIPGEMYDATNKGDVSTITNAFGGTTTIIATTHVLANDSFAIGIDKIPAAACVSIATTEWGGDSGSGLVAMAIQTNTDSNAVATLLSTATSSNDTGASAGTAVAMDDTGTGGGSGSYIAKVSALPISVVAAGTYCQGDENGLAWKYL